MRLLTTALLLCALASVPAHSRVLTVSNHPASPAQFTTIEAAMDMANAGDTLLITGSPTSYGAINLGKQLTLIGPGYAAVLSHPASITTLILDNAAASGSRFYGLNITGYLFTSVSNVTDGTVERCKIQYVSLTQNASNWNIRHCFIRDRIEAYGGQPDNLIISNNVIGGRVQGFTSPSVLVLNNVFLGTGTQVCLINLQNTLIANNIFWGTSPVNADVQNCTFSNNITYQTSGNIIPYGTNTGSDNLLGTDPRFTNAPTQNIDNHTYDYRLQPISPGRNAGTDGTDIGLYGGALPMPNTSGAPRIPSITEFILRNATIAEGGSLDVQLKARKND